MAPHGSDDDAGKAAAAKVPEWQVPDELPSSMPWLEVQDVTWGVFTKVRFAQALLGRRRPRPVRRARSAARLPPMDPLRAGRPRGRTDRVAAPRRTRRERARPALAAAPLYCQRNRAPDFAAAQPRGPPPHRR